MLRKYSFMQTTSGRKFCLEDDEPDFTFDDIAWSLARQCRYAGHVKPGIFYSVAEHCCTVAHLAYGWAMEQKYPHDTAKRVAWNGLMHDASEAFLSDIVRPMKQYLPQYYDLELVIQRKIDAKYDCGVEMHEIVRELDERILLDERKFVMNHKGVEWETDYEPIGLPFIKAMWPNDAYVDFKKSAEAFAHVPLN